METLSKPVANTDHKLRKWIHISSVYTTLTSYYQLNIYKDSSKLKHSKVGE